MASKTTPVEFPVVTGGEAFWLDSRTLAHIVGDDIYAVSLEYDASPSSLVRVPQAPYLVGSFPQGSNPTNFRFTASKTVHTNDKHQPILVFSAKVYDDYNLTSVKEQDEEWENRGSSAMVYDQLYVRHWDEYSSKKRSRLFSVDLHFHKGQNEVAKWVLGKDFFKPLDGTKHVSRS